MTLETYIRAEMARFAIEEAARHGGVNNMLAVLHVLRNRVFAGWGDWVEVVQKASEKRATIYPPDFPNLKTNDIRLLLNRVEEVYSRQDLVDLTGGALFYFDQGYPIEQWFKDQVLNYPDDHKRTAHIGPVWFYK